MWKTVSFLVFTLLIIPVAIFFLDTSLSPLQKEVIYLLVKIYGVAALLTFLVSTFTNNYSQVDKLWSIMPIAYVWVAFSYDPTNLRVLIMALLVTFWGIRLTYNFSRRGGYSLKFWEGEEDYRWSVLRSRKEFKAGWKWALFNFFFISLYQMALILLMTFPIVKVLGPSSINYWDYFLAIIMGGLIIFETIADQQQWNFQNAKRSRTGKAESKYADGFVKEGLWAVVRHPNYACEQAIWITFYFFSVNATGMWINWSISGCLLLILLFKGSADFSESISASKYPAYKDYIKYVPRFVPFSKSLRKLKNKSPEQVQGL